MMNEANQNHVIEGFFLLVLPVFARQSAKEMITLR